jgi:hypothetical protein
LLPKDFPPFTTVQTDVPPFSRLHIESLWLEINRLGAICAFDM